MLQLCLAPGKDLFWARQPLAIEPRLAAVVRRANFSLSSALLRLIFFKGGLSAVALDQKAAKESSRIARARARLLILVLLAESPCFAKSPSPTSQ